ncbi:MAG: hypothetical protein M5U22_21640 [Thermoleophilia bacterium]|nr:hypothetical protein [Thermoleophilia bacterium]
MKRQKVIASIALAAVVLLVLGTGVAFAYGTGYRSGWCLGPVQGQAATNASTPIYRGGTPPAEPVRTAAAMRAVPDCPGPGWCWDASNWCRTPPASSDGATVPSTVNPAPAPGSPGYSPGYCYRGGGCCR